MAILNNTLCDKCRAFDRCDEQYGGGVPPCAKLVEKNVNSVQQLKPKMPSWEEMWNQFNEGFVWCGGSVVESDVNHSAKRMYDIIARHFGH